eukprot:EW703749.1.p3 GENE.EW703749.1~~EW703749.1.p3  ORF type:complete len:90 (-),score=12.26 EW703749.1:7-276(-)
MRYCVCVSHCSSISLPFGGLRLHTCACVRPHLSAAATVLLLFPAAAALLLHFHLPPPTLQLPAPCRSAVGFLFFYRSSLSCRPSCLTRP